MRSALASILALSIVACGEAGSGTLDDPDAAVSPPPPPPPDTGVIDSGVRDTGVRPDTGTTPYDPNCASCRADGETCTYSINCAPGSICNDPVEMLYDPTQPTGVCIRVVCTPGGNDCIPPKECSPEGICRDPTCQRDVECAPGNVCIAGGCRPPPSPMTAAACRAITPNTTLRLGQTLELRAIALDSNGTELHGVELEWISSNPLIVSISGSTASTGPLSGQSMLSASVLGNSAVSCEGPLINVLEPVSMASTRVTVIELETGTPINGASVEIFTTGVSIDSTTGFDGSVTFANRAIDWVAAISNGRQGVMVIEPDSAEILIALPLARDRTQSAGFRGSIDFSSTRMRDLQLGIARGALSSDLPDLMRGGFCAEKLPQVLDAPELGLNNEPVELPANFVMALGNKKFTADGAGMRCNGAVQGSRDVGCYLAPGHDGNDAAWALGAELRLSQIIPIANQLSQSFMNFCNSDTLEALGSFSTNLRHGLVPTVSLTAAPKVMGQPDYASYSSVNIAARSAASIYSVITLPTLPVFSALNSCANGLFIIPLAELPQRGLVPFGFTTARDGAEGQLADCRVDGRNEPFGSSSAPLAQNQVPLVMSPLHSGAEGSKISIAMVAFDRDSLGAEGVPVALSTLVRTTDAIDPSIDESGRGFLAFPSATIARMAGVVAIGSSLARVTAVRIDLEQGDNVWTVYAPPSAMFEIPRNMLIAPVLDNADHAWITVMETDVAYPTLFDLSMARTLANPIGRIQGYAVGECTPAMGACTLQ